MLPQTPRPIVQRNLGLVLGRLVQFIGALLNETSDNLDPGIIAGLSQRPLAHTLGAEPTEEEVAAALLSMANAKVVGPDELPVELLKLGLHHEVVVLREFHRENTLVWRKGRVPQRCSKFFS